MITPAQLKGQRSRRRGQHNDVPVICSVRCT